MTIRTLLVLLSLLSLVPVAAAEDVCVGDGLTGACAIANPDDRFAYYGAFAYDASTGTFVAGGYGEGSGFFADTATADVFGYNMLSGQYVVVVIAFNDYGRDGEYDDGSFYAGTWNDDAAVPAVGHGGSFALP